MPISTERARGSRRTCRRCTRVRRSRWNNASTCPRWCPKTDGAAEGLARQLTGDNRHQRRLLRDRGGSVPGARAIRQSSAGRAISRRRISPTNTSPWRSSKPDRPSWSGCWSICRHEIPVHARRRARACGESARCVRSGDHRWRGHRRDRRRFSLRGRACRSLLLEKGRVAAEQSSRNWGWIRVQGRDVAEIPIALEAQKLWRELDGTGGASGRADVGVTYLAASRAGAGRLPGLARLAEGLGLDSHMVSRKNCRGCCRGITGDWPGRAATRRPT